MKNRIGLKLWSPNKNYISSAKELLNIGVFDYIELYAVPNTLEFLELWQDFKRETGALFAIHAPHFSHGLDFSNKQKRDTNLKMADETFIWSNALQAQYTVFHPGIGGSLDESLYQISNLKKHSKIDFIVENKPYVVTLNKDKKQAFCIGSDYESIKKIKQTGVGLCLDIGHAICSANYQGLEIYEYVKLLNSLNPQVYHISDNNSKSIYDAHLHFGDGDFDFNKLVNLIDKDKFLAIETNKDSSENLDDFLKDVKFIKEIK